MCCDMPVGTHHHENRFDLKHGVTIVYTGRGLDIVFDKDRKDIKAPGKAQGLKELETNLDKGSTAGWTNYNKVQREVDNRTVATCYTVQLIKHVNLPLFWLKHCEGFVLVDSSDADRPVCRIVTYTKKTPNENEAPGIASGQEPGGFCAALFVWRLTLLSLFLFVCLSLIKTFEVLYKKCPHCLFWVLRGVGSEK